MGAAKEKQQQAKDEARFANDDTLNSPYLGCNKTECLAENKQFIATNAANEQMELTCASATR